MGDHGCVYAMGFPELVYQLPGCDRIPAVENPTVSKTDLIAQSQTVALLVKLIGFMSLAAGFTWIPSSRVIS